jgi:hypothetical protein
VRTFQLFKAGGRERESDGVRQRGRERERGEGVTGLVEAKRKIMAKK